MVVCCLKSQTLMVITQNLTMRETQSQEIVTSAIIEQHVTRATVGLTENECAVLVEVEDETDSIEAAYTADEARELADAVEATSRQRWQDDAEEMWTYLREVADVVDGVKDKNEMKSGDTELNP